VVSVLPWHFEAFREYISYQTLLSASAVLRQFEGEEITPSNPRIQQMQNLLVLRTGKDSWIPSRSGSADVDWNLEGDVYRNKGRLLSSLFILEPKNASIPPSVKLLPFGRALAKGEVSEQEFYDFIITRFCYPHPAWDDNWRAWTAQNKRLFPFRFILQVLIELDKTKPLDSFLTTEEIAIHLYPVSDHSQVINIVESVMKSRLLGQSVDRERTDKVDRKITDICGFLCLSGYCFYTLNGKAIGLNLRDQHRKELTMFERSRLNQDRLKEIKTLIN